MDQGTQCDLTLRENENDSISSPLLENLGRSRCRRSSIRHRDGFSIDAKKDGFDQKPAAKMLPSTRGRNGVKPSVSYSLYSALTSTSGTIISNHWGLNYCNCNAHPN